MIAQHTLSFLVVFILNVTIILFLSIYYICGKKWSQIDEIVMG